MPPRENIHVAIRIRPRLAKDIQAQSVEITDVTPGEPQVTLNQHSFTFDHVFDVNSKQNQVYETVVQDLVDGCFDGFNATIFAYGQTGSGKTHTMGTCFDIDVPENDRGIIPRALDHFFTTVTQRKQAATEAEMPPPEFQMTTQFIEIYNEELRDLICDYEKGGTRRAIHISDDPKNGIVLNGATNKSVKSVDEALAVLKRGSLFRTTGATKMNAESSRSHAIFTLFVNQTRFEKASPSESQDSDTGNGDWVRISAKFNFVDLAGSERLSRTQAVGERMKEGIKINSGLLHLGNVISKLGDPANRGGYVNYRDSKLTRILQDSLGGNSVTTMIACVSPCDFDFVETLNTLRYANRAKNIKNKAVANQDSNAQLISQLRKRIAQLEYENSELRQGNDVALSHAKFKSDDTVTNYDTVQTYDMKDKFAIKYEDINNEMTYANVKGNGIPKDNGVDSDVGGDSDAGDDSDIEDDFHEGDDDDGDSDSSDSDKRAEHERSMEAQSAQLTTLIATIESKEKVINEYEERNQKFRDLADNYEKRIVHCKHQIKEIEKERDTLLKKITDENMSRKVKDMEKEIEALHKELKSFERMRTQHEQLIKKETKSKEEIRKMRQEVTDAKAKRVQIIQEMRKAQNNFQKATHKQRQELNRLITQDTKKNRQINSLQAESLQQKAIIKRKNEELINLKKRQTNGRVVNKAFTPKNSKLRDGAAYQTPQKIRKTWIDVENRFDTYVKNKLQFEYEEKKLNNYFKQKEECIKLLEDVNDDHEYIEDLKQNLDFIQKNIEDCQSIILGLDSEEFNWDKLWNAIYATSSHEEIGYYLNKLTQSSLNYAILSWQREEIILQKESVINEKNNEINRMQQSMDWITKMLQEGGNAADISHSKVQRLATNKRRAMKPEELLLSIHKHEETINNTIMMIDDSSKDASDDSAEATPMDTTIITDTNSTNNLKQALSANAPLQHRSGEKRLTGELGVMQTSFNRSNNTIQKNEATFPLVCRETIAGAHTRPILSLCATDKYVISGSRDNTAKIWDINTATVTSEFIDHSDFVNVVRYHEIQQQLFTVSNNVIKIWDTRADNRTLVKMLSTMGVVSNDAQAPQTPIDDIQLSQCGNYLYHTCDRIVKVIDLRNYQTVAKFNSGHGSKITCIAIAESSDFNSVLATGSKDHSVKLFDVENPPSGNNTPKYVLKPPHYDGVETVKLTRNGNTLFSGGRDGYIKKFDLQSEKLISNFGHFVSGVFVCSLEFMLDQTILLSGYRSGLLRLWSVDTATPMGETMAHPNAELKSVASNKDHCFTAGSDGIVKIWCMPEDPSLNL